MSTPRELVKQWRHKADEAEKAQKAYHAFGKIEAEKRMEIRTEVYRHCAEELDAALGRVS